MNAPLSTTTAAATEKQIAFIRRLTAERPAWQDTLNGNVYERCFDVCCDPTKFVGKAEASAVIDALLRIKPAAAKPAPAAGYVAERGDVHVVDGVYYRVHIAQQSGKPYACRADITAAATWADDVLVEAGEVSWVYVAGGMRLLSTATKATPAESKAFGMLVGRCCYCSRAIDTPESTTAGYGPICAAKYGLPWG